MWNSKTANKLQRTCKNLGNIGHMCSSWIIIKDELQAMKKIFRWFWALNICKKLLSINDGDKGELINVNDMI